MPRLARFSFVNPLQSVTRHASPPVAQLPPSTPVRQLRASAINKFGRYDGSLHFLIVIPTPPVWTKFSYSGGIRPRETEYRFGSSAFDPPANLMYADYPSVRTSSLRRYTVTDVNPR